MPPWQQTDKGEGMPPKAIKPTALNTLTIDVGGTGLKATVLDGQGQPLHDRVRIPTTFPTPPAKLVEDLGKLVEGLPAYDRVSVGFPGAVRGGRVRTAPAFSTTAGLGTEIDPELVHAWENFDLASALSAKLGKPCRVANDADVQGAGAVSGVGLEFIMTLGTGVGTAAFLDGRLALHLELAHHPLSGDATYNDYLGDRALRDCGKKKWNRRVVKAIAVIDALVLPDAILVGGGNAKHLTAELDPKVRLVDNTAGLLGGIKLWEGAGLE
jgi:polyphosphate glucokinase